MQKYLTATNAALLLGVISALAHFVQAVAPTDSVAFKVAGKALALGPNFYAFFGAHPNPEVKS